ncbi:TonB-dependent receptor [Ramlibacter albus]|uniref:TonB-dependent receptor n=1 Tax=Ramlibacter albus TaxID=2079448 RepID=A0A923S1L7_9BURK|nr:TonB-dependent receptor [Ramlibacter albus]MBC5763823.1 TonB-dependent receptor [Ramlibacter albus]
MAIRAAACLSLLCLPLALRAQTATPLPEVSVRATRAVPGSMFSGEPFAVPAGWRVAEDLSGPGLRSISSALQSDPAIGESYAITGYYENFTVRGFALDHGSSYRINGLVVPAEMHIGLDDKQAIEVVRGSGNHVGPAGTINFITKRPADVRALRLETSQRGGGYALVDLGRAATNGFGWRLNLAHEAMQPVEHHAEGHRDFVGAAFDLAPSTAWHLNFDTAYGRRAQPAVPGFQLLGGTMAPEVDPRTNINQQPWSRPVRNESRLLAVRSEHDLAAALKLRWAASDAAARIDDSLAFPLGCNDAPYHFFCADRSYVLYDYRSFERRRTTHAITSLAGESVAGAAHHAWRVGLEQVRRRIEQRQLYSTTLVDDAGRALTGSLDRVAQPLPAPPASGADLPKRIARQGALFAAHEIAWRKWRVTVGARAAHIAQSQGRGAARLLPHAALAWERAEGEILFANAARSIDFGAEAPVAAQNAGALLPPREMRQFEAGWRRMADDRELSITAFRMARPFHFVQPAGSSWAGLGDFTQAGTQVHTGIEFAAKRTWGRSIEAGVEGAALRAVARGTGEPAYDGRQVQNVARLRTSAWVAAMLPDLPGLRAELRWLHSGRRNARADGLAQVAGYDRFDAGLRWEIGERVALQAAVENLANRRYWRDAGFAYGADLLFPGRPRTLTAGLVIQAR